MHLLYKMCQAETRPRVEEEMFFSLHNLNDYQTHSHLSQISPAAFCLMCEKKQFVQRNGNNSHVLALLCLASC